MAANTSAPNGFQRFGLLDGASPTMGFQQRLVAQADTNAIGYGDPVVSLGTGYVTLATAGTTQISGIFMGCYYLNTAVGRVVWSKSWPGSSAGGNGFANIDTDPNALYIAQSNNTAIVFADIDANINFVLGTPQTESAGGYSTSMLDQSTIATTDTLPFRIVGTWSPQFVPAGSQNGSDNTTPYNRVIISPNYTDRRSRLGIV